MSPEWTQPRLPSGRGKRDHLSMLLYPVVLLSASTALPAALSNPLCVFSSLWRLFFEDKNLILSSLVSLHFSAWGCRRYYSRKRLISFPREQKHLACVLYSSSEAMQNTSKIPNCLINLPGTSDEPVAKIISNNETMNIKHVGFQRTSTCFLILTMCPTLITGTSHPNDQSTQSHANGLSSQSVFSDPGLTFWMDRQNGGWKEHKPQAMTENKIQVSSS